MGDSEINQLNRAQGIKLYYLHFFIDFISISFSDRSNSVVGGVRKLG
jgi:hypothetical protein